MKIYHDRDADLKVFDGKVVAVLGYGSQGRAQALCFHDSGIDVVVGVRKNGKSWKKAKEDGLKVAEIPDAVRQADVVMMLLPDEVQPEVYKELVEPNLKEGAALEFAHGFSITYKLIVPPSGVDVIMMAPKAPGDMERLIFTEGFGVPALICVYQDVTGNAKNIALGLAKGLGATRAGVFESTFDNETFTDLFGEQSVLCGGQTELIKRGFETLVEAGYPPEMAYFEVLHETKLIVDLINKGGFDLMWSVVSNTAEYGGMTRRERVVTQQSKDAMVQILKEIEDGTFKTQWRAEYDNGLTELKRMEEEERKLQIEVVGKEIRKLFERKKRIRSVETWRRRSTSGLARGFSAPSSTIPTWPMPFGSPSPSPWRST
jgi:ketol-acid reductoisomerase